MQLLVLFPCPSSWPDLFEYIVAAGASRADVDISGLELCQRKLTISHTLTMPGMASKSQLATTCHRIVRSRDTFLYSPIAMGWSKAHKTTRGCAQAADPGP